MAARAAASAEPRDDIDVDLDSLSGMADMLVGELFGGSAGFDPGELEAVGNEWEARGNEFEQHFDADALRRELEEAARDLLEHQRRHRQQDRPRPTPPTAPPAPTPPTAPAAPSLAPVAPVAPTVPV